MDSMENRKDDIQEISACEEALESEELDDVNDLDSMEIEDTMDVELGRDQNSPDSNPHGRSVAAFKASLGYDDSLLYGRYDRIIPGVYKAKIGKITASYVDGKYGRYAEVKIPFEFNTADGDKKLIYKTSNSLSPKGKLYPLIKEFFGTVYNGFPIPKLEGKKAEITVVDEERKDGEGYWTYIAKIQKAA